MWRIDSDILGAKKCAMTKPRAGIDHTAIVSLARAVVGVLAWPFVDGWVLLLVATLSLVLGFLVRGTRLVVQSLCDLGLVGRGPL